MEIGIPTGYVGSVRHNWMIKFEDISLYFAKLISSLIWTIDKTNKVVCLSHKTSLPPFQEFSLFCLYLKVYWNLYVRMHLYPLQIAMLLQRDWECSQNSVVEHYQIQRFQRFFCIFEPTVVEAPLYHCWSHYSAYESFNHFQHQYYFHCDLLNLEVQLCNKGSRKITDWSLVTRRFK